MSTLPATTDVLIIGAGPTGLTLGCVLAGKGISCVLVDRLAEGANTSRAAVVHARTLEVLEEVGVAERLRAQGHIVARFTLRDRDRVLATIRFDGLPTKYPYTLMVPQNVTEATLLNRLRELGGDVSRPYAAENLTQDQDGVSVTVAADGQQPRTVRAKYVVGADGMHSVVRERAGIGFTGERYEQSFVLADVHMTWQLSSDEVMLFFSPAGLAVVAPLPGGRYRIVATVDEAPERPNMAEVQELVDARGPVRNPARITEMFWSTRFRVHHRMANAYRAGRILIAGDAAHVHSPAGGQGMNTGIQDGIALGHALIETLRAGNDASPLDRYAGTRRPIAERVVGFTDRLTRMATLRNRPGRLARNTLFTLVGSIPPARRWLATELAGLRNRGT